MNRALALGLIYLFVLSGCSESYHPTRSEKPAAEEGASLGQSTDPLLTSEPVVVEAEEDAANVQGLGVDVEAGAIQLTAPENWNRKPPRSQFVNAEFALPKAGGDEQDGRVTVSIAGGTIEANVDRWRSQFGGTPDAESQEEVTIGDLKMTVVDYSGTFNDQAGPFAPGVQRENYRMMAAIVPVGEQLHFIKAYGPAKTMATYQEAFREFLKTAQRN